MPNPRRSGGNTAMRVSSCQMLPEVSGSSPARQFNAVDLPNPEGPSRARNSERRISRPSPLGAAVLPTVRPRPRSLRVSNVPDRRASAGASVAPRGDPVMQPPLPLFRRRVRRPMSLVHLRATDLAVPTVEGRDHRLGVEWRFFRVVGDQLVVLRPAVASDDLLTQIGRAHV